MFKKKRSCKVQSACSCQVNGGERVLGMRVVLTLDVATSACVPQPLIYIIKECNGKFTCYEAVHSNCLSKCDSVSVLFHCATLAEVT